tara:strand:- start:8190 stop:8732 length:543 start_codon:yes stop_codon:yes gene_type:complete
MNAERFRIDKTELRVGMNYWLLEQPTRGLELTQHIWDEESKESDNKNIFFTPEHGLNFIRGIGMGSKTTVSIFSNTNPRGKKFIFDVEEDKWKSGATVMSKGNGARSLLSLREYQVAGLLKEGHRNLYIAKEMGVSEKTISSFVRRIYNKCGLDTIYNVHMLLVQLEELGLYMEGGDICK